jgi:hypothetical protein
VWMNVMDKFFCFWPIKLWIHPWAALSWSHKMSKYGLAISSSWLVNLESAEISFYQRLLSM